MTSSHCCRWHYDNPARNRINTLNQPCLAADSSDTDPMVELAYDEGGSG